MPTRPASLTRAGKILTLSTLFAALGTFAFYAHVLFLQYPPVWPDEALYANPAIELLWHGSFGTTFLFEGILPDVAKHTYLQPPLYGLCLWVVFKVWGVGIVLARLVSTLAAVAVLLLTYKVGLQSGLNRWLALLPVSMLAADTVFLRGALIARMDMLALGFILLALYLGVDPASPDGFPGKSKSFFAGVVCGLAALTHPFGAVASAALILWLLFGGQDCRRRKLPFLLAGIFAPLACWGAYIAQDRRSFIVQFDAQLMRKVGRNPLTLHGLYPALKTYLLQYGEPSLLIALAWILGLAGLWLATRRQKYVFPLLVCGIATMGLMIWSDEMWYGLYLLPLTMMGLVHLARLEWGSEFSWRKGFPRKLLGWLAILLLL